MGTGIQRIARAMEEHGLSRPTFEELGGEFRVTLIGPGERFMEKTPGIVRELDLNDRQRQALTHLRKYGRITRQEYGQLTGTQHTVASSELRDLAEKGLVSRRGAGRGTYYVLP
jgi:ATP-dependent DNA helicase RecG